MNQKDTEWFGKMLVYLCLSIVAILIAIVCIWPLQCALAVGGTLIAVAHLYVFTR